MNSTFRNSIIVRAAIQIGLCSLVGSFFCVPVLAAESISVLLQKGIYAEETEGNLEAAIKIYEGITKESDANRSLVAQAQYRLGVCELKRGRKQEAVTAFRKLVDQYSDAAELVAKSRERLLELGQPAAATVVRLVSSGAPEGTSNRISPDGRLLAFIDWDTGNLAVRDLTTGQNRQLTKQGSWKETVQFTESFAFSPDGTQLAYDWLRVESRQSSSAGLYTVNVQDGTIRTLIGQQTNRWFSGHVGDWSPDGKSIALFEYSGEQTNWHGGISLINTANGATRSVTHGVLVRRWTTPSTLRFSPDGRYLAYNLARNVVREIIGERPRPTNDIYLLELATGIAKRAIENLANEEFIGWAPRGSDLLFTSERRGKIDLWAARVNNNELESQPMIARPDVGDIAPIGFTRAGAFFYSSELRNWTELYLTSVDFQAGQVLSPPKYLKTVFPPKKMMSNKFGTAADRNFEFYCSGNQEPAAYVLDISSGEEREIQNSRAWASQVQWWWPSPDGASLLVSLFGGENQTGLFRVNTKTGEKSPFALHRPGVRPSIDNPIHIYFDENFAAYGRQYLEPKRFVLVKHDFKLDQETEYDIPGLSSDYISGEYRNRASLLSDGRTFLFNREDSPGKSYTLMHHDLITGKQEELFHATSRIGIVSGPRFPQIFIVTQDDRDRFVFRLFSFTDSHLRQIGQTTVPEDFEYRGQVWNEPHLLLIKKEDLRKGGLAERWTLSVGTSELKKTGFSAPSDQFLGIAARAGRPFVHKITRSGSREIWVMENFLSQMTTAR